MLLRALIPFTLLSLSILSCKDNAQKHNSKIRAFIDSLNEVQVGQMDYLISIPKNYSIKEREGPDFSVFYFADSDTTALPDFAGGMYFGNYPNKFPALNDSCKVRTQESEILGKNSTWTIFECNGQFSAQTIIDSKSDEGWNDKIHAFGHGRSKEDLEKLLAIYSTLRQKR